ncbi:MAG TPA: hypothetical protein VN844_28580, partial [Pyrinomonadaceae bacterium]|nr:hypothetical protein [Pyrinomonadaceae bacterium]
GRKNPKRVNPRGGARDYRVATRAISPNGVAGDTVVGVTVWRLRPAHADVEGERIVVHESERDEKWIAERVTGRTRFAEGDRVRLTIEAARAGYLYVVDREQYADGKLGEPHLIFPTTRTHGGDNRVQSGLLIDIPAQSDRPPYLTLRRTRTDHSAEVLSFIVTKSPLEGVQITDRAQTLSAEQVAAWEKSWGGPPGRLELTGGAGQAWTKTEREASAVSARLLNNNAPVPQTIYYNPAIKSDAPFLVTVRLNYARSRASVR